MTSVYVKGNSHCRPHQIDFHCGKCIGCGRASEEIQDIVMLKVIIAGSRGFNNYQLLVKTCDHMLQNHEQVEIVSGGAIGADKLGELYAEENMYDMRRFEPDCGTFGNVAEFIRNKAMADYADALIAFWDGTDKDILNMIQVARLVGIKIKVCNY